MPKRYRVLVPLVYPAESGPGDRRAAPGEVVSDIPAQSVPWLLAAGYIEEVKSRG